MWYFHNTGIAIVKENVTHIKFNRYADKRVYSIKFFFVDNDWVEIEDQEDLDIFCRIIMENIEHV
jgi:hypothetical protein